MADVLLNQGEKVVLNNSGSANIIITNPVGSGNMNLQNPGGKIAFPDAIDSAHALLIGGSHLLWRDTSLILRTDARFETPMLIARGTVTIDGNETDAYIRLERSGTAKWQIGRFGTGDDLDFLKDSGTGWMKLTYAGGQLQLPQLGSGAGILLGGDANLYRSAANVLKTDDSLEVNVNLTVAGNIVVAGTVDGVDVSAHAANVNAHHAQTHSDADHTLGQYALLTGRAAGQILCGGTLANDYIQIDSTSHATKGQIRFHNAQNFIDANGNLTIAGQLSVGGGYGNTGLTVDGNGTIQTNGNFQVRRDGPHSVPTLMYLGREEQVQVIVNPPTYEPGHLNYVFWQNRINRAGWYWAGWNTFRHPNTVPPVVSPSPTPPAPTTREIVWGYGYYPFRNWSKNYLLEASGAIMSKQYILAPQIFFQKLKHINLVTGLPEDPFGYDSNDRPYIFRDNPILQTNLTQNVGQSDDGPVTINVQSTTAFLVGDEVFISDNTGQGGSLRGDINEVQTIISSTQMTLKRGSSAFTAPPNSTGKVQRVTELGGVQQTITDFGTKIVREGNELAFYDSAVTAGKRLGRLVTGLENNVKVDRGITSGTPFTIAANTDYTPADGPGDPGSISFNSPFSSNTSYKVIPVVFNVLNAYGVTIAIRGHFSDRFTWIARNNHPTSQAQFQISWVAIGT